MRNKNNLKVFVTLIIVTVLCICGVIRFFSINSKYPQNEKVVYKMGDSFVCQNAKFTITDTYMLKRMDIMNDDDLSEYLEENSDYLKSEDLNLGLIKIIISNTTDDEITVDLTAFHIESGAFSLQFYYPLVMYYNDCGMYIKLSKGEQKTFIAPVPISSEQFLNYDSTDIRNRTYYLVSSLYPQKIMSEVKFN